MKGAVHSPHQEVSSPLGDTSRRTGGTTAVARAARPDAESKPPSTLWNVCIFILIVEMSERLCYYTLAGSQRNFLEDVGPPRADGSRGLKQSTAFSLSACFSMLSYMSCFLGGYLADNRLGRYRTILVFASLYAVGVAVVAVSAAPSIMRSEYGLDLYLLGAFIFVSLGTGAIKPNVMNFGAEQYDDSTVAGKQQRDSFFSYFYLMINVGVVFAFGFTANLATSGSTTTSAGNGYFEAYVIAAVAMCAAIITFVAGSPRYQGKGRAARVPVITAIRDHLLDAARRTTKGKFAILGWCLMPVYMTVVLVGASLSSHPALSNGLTWAAFCLAVLSSGLLVYVHIDNSYLPTLNTGKAATTDGGIATHDVKGALKCVPTILCINIGFNILYNSMNNAYPAQACQMNTVFWGTQINGVFFTLGDAAAILIGVPILEKFILPALQRRGGSCITSRAKYAAGFGFAVLANLSAMGIECVRRGRSTGDAPAFVKCPTELLGSSECRDGDLLSKCSPGGSLPMTDMSAMWAFVPMLLTGIGEILVNPVVYNYAFNEAPDRLRSIVQSLNLVAAGAVSNAITASFGPLVPHDMNEGRINHYFIANILVAGMMLAIYLAFVPPDHGEATQTATKSDIVAKVTAHPESAARLSI